MLVRRGPSPKLCPDCLETATEEREKQNRKRYYAKRVGKTLDEVREYRPRATEPNQKPPDNSRRFRWTGGKSVCKNTACPFRHGNRPCLFYFEYKDGSFTCANMRGRAKREDK